MWLAEKSQWYSLPSSIYLYFCNTMFLQNSRSWLIGTVKALAPVFFRSRRSFNVKLFTAYASSTLKSIQLLNLINVQYPFVKSVHATYLNASVYATVQISSKHAFSADGILQIVNSIRYPGGSISLLSNPCRARSCEKACCGMSSPPFLFPSKTALPIQKVYGGAILLWHWHVWFNPASDLFTSSKFSVMTATWVNFLIGCAKCPPFLLSFRPLACRWMYPTLWFSRGIWYYPWCSLLNSLCIIAGTDIFP